MKHRAGKIVYGPHSTRVEGLNNFLHRLAKWPEIEQIRIGALKTRHSVGRKSKKLKTEIPKPEAHPEMQLSDEGIYHGGFTARAHPRPQLGGGFRFRAKGWAMADATIVTGIRCIASHGRTLQEVVLTSEDREALKRRLVKEGLCEDF